MSYSTATFQAVSIILFIHIKTSEGLYEYLSTKHISEMLNIPVPTSVKILHKLNVSGITSSKEGAKGGIFLNLPISKITMLDVFKAIEQGKPLFKVHHNFNFEYDKLEDIRNKAVGCLNNAETSMEEELKKVTLMDLLK